MKRDLWAYVNVLNMNFNALHESGMLMNLYFSTD